MSSPPSCSPSPCASFTTQIATTKIHHTPQQHESDHGNDDDEHAKDDTSCRGVKRKRKAQTFLNCSDCQPATLLLQPFTHRVADVAQELNITEAGVVDIVRAYITACRAWTTRCNDCDGVLCEKCASECLTCGKSLCSECRQHCSRCFNWVCMQTCGTHCDGCLSLQFCPDCITVDGDGKWCGICLDEKEDDNDDDADAQQTENGAHIPVEERLDDD